MTNSDSSQPAPLPRQPADGGDCQHEWIACQEYDSMVDKTVFYLECRLCDARQTGFYDEYVHGFESRITHLPDATWKLNYRKPSRVVKGTP